MQYCSYRISLQSVNIRYHKGEVADDIIATLLNNKNLAMFVQSLIMKPPFPHYAPMSNGTIQILSKATSGKWLDSRTCADAKAVIVLQLLLAHLINLRSLVVNAGGHWDVSVTLAECLAMVPYDNLSPELRSCDIYFRNPQDFGYFHTLLSKTKIVQLRIHHCVDIETPFRCASYARVKELELRSCAFSRSALERLLTNCRKLTLLSYHVDRCFRAMQYRATAREVITLLADHKETLETLNLSVNGGSPERFFERDMANFVEEHDTVPSLIDFKCLRQLSIDRFDLTRTLKGDLEDSEEYDAEHSTVQASHESLRPVNPLNFFEKLPRSLESLCIERVTSSIIPILAKAPDMVATSSPNLRTLRLIHFGTKAKDIERRFESIAKACKGHSLRLLYDARSRWPLPPHFYK